MSVRLPTGVKVIPLAMHRDARGVFTEVFREEWATGVAPIQWNVVRSESGVMRGVHTHVRHADYLTVARGRVTAGLRDVRRGSPTEGLVALVDLDGEAMSAITIPVGVAHGFFFHEPTLHVYAVTHYWNLEDELGCQWTDPALGIPWPTDAATLSERDAQAGSFSAMLARLEPYQPIGAATPD